MTLNKEELIVASTLTLIVVPFPMAMLAVPLCAFLWALTGSESKWNYKLWRRLGVPLVWALCLWKREAFFVVPVAYGLLSLGYGIPSTQPFDEGSWLGRLALKLTGNTTTANLLTRGIIYTGLVVPFLVARWI